VELLKNFKEVKKLEFSNDENIVGEERFIPVRIEVKGIEIL
jgi:hypothetical protein